MSSKKPFDAHQRPPQNKDSKGGAETRNLNQDDASRAAKRRRVGMGMPSADGFISSMSTTTPTNQTTKAKPVHKPPVPRFVSAFDVDNGHEHDRDNNGNENMNRNEDGKAKMAPKTQSRAISVSKLPLPLHVVGLRIAGPSTSRSDRSPLISDADVSNGIGLGPRLVMSKFKDREKKRIGSAPNLSMNFALIQNGTTKPRSTTFANTNTTTTTNLRLRPAPAPPAIVVGVANSSTTTTTTIPNPNLKQIMPPQLALSSPKASKPLQPVQPPVLPLPPSKHKGKNKELYALSSTGLGFLNDLSSEHVAEGLAGILLRDQHPELLEMQMRGGVNGGAEMRGLEMSPQKDKLGKGKNKYSRFVRGGLAARAAAHFERTSTAHILWKKDVERSANTHTHTPPALRARIIKILHTPTHTSRPPSYAPGIALCQVRLPNGGAHPTYKPDRLYRVILATPAAATAAADTEDYRAQFAVGRIISIFKPWNELCTSSDGPSSSPEAPRRPARLPMPMSTPTPTPDPFSAPVHPTALICTRFHIQPNP